MADVSSEDLLTAISGFYSTVVLGVLAWFVYNRTSYRYKRRLNKIRKDLINFDLHLPEEIVCSVSEHSEIIRKITSFSQDLDLIRGRIALEMGDDSILFMETTVIQEHLDQVFIRVVTATTVENDLFH